jgi:catechol 2,3-dioxygenase-like lactoylglutathione lyase family enzyme
MFTFIRSLSAVAVLAFVGATALHPSSDAAFAAAATQAAAMAPQVKPSSALIKTADVAKTADWYRSVLGFQLISERTGVQGRSALLERRGTLLEVSEEDRIAEGSDPVALTLLVDDVDREVDALQAKGVEVVSEPHDELSSRFRVSRIYDEGHRVVELREPLGSGETHFGHQEF